MKKLRFFRAVPLFLLAAALWAAAVPASATEYFDYDKELERIVDLADPEWPDVDKALFFYQYLTENFTYDITIGSAPELFATGAGNCDAFSNAYMELLRQVDVPCERAGSERMDHAWNLVELGGQWYHADPTWENSSGRGTTYFLKSDEEFQALRHHDWAAGHDCPESYGAISTDPDLSYNNAGEEHKSGLFTYQVIPNTNKAIITKYDGIAAAITIPETLDGNTVVTIGYRAFSGKNNFYTVILPDSLRRIGSHAFDGCGILETVEFASGPVRICDYAFANCTKLDELVCRSASALGASAFEGCTGLTSVTLAPLDGRTLPLGDRLFYGCTYLQTVTLGTGITDVGARAFEGCRQLPAITLPEGGQTLGASAFEGCKALGSVSLPSSLRTIDVSAFQGCTALTGIDLPRGLTAIYQGAFQGCTSLTTLSLPDGVETIPSLMAQGCTGLQWVDFSGSTIEWEAFRGCTSLERAPLPEGLVKVEYSAFQDCTALTEVTLPSTLTSMEKDAFRDCTGLTAAVLSSGMTALGERAFYGCTALSSLTLPDGLTSIGDGALWGCAGLKQIRLPDSLTALGVSALRETGLTSVALPQGLGEVPAGCFLRCTGLRQVGIPNSVVKIGANAFQDCGLITLALPDGLTEIGGLAFAGCYALTDVTLPASVTKLGSTAFQSGGDEDLKITLLGPPPTVDKTPFGPNQHLAVYVPVGKWGWPEDGGLWNGYTVRDAAAAAVLASGSCGAKLAYVLDGAYTLTLTGSGAMTDYSSGKAPWSPWAGQIAKLVLAPGQTSLGAYAFAGLTALTDVEVPSKVTVLGAGAFSGCRSLTAARFTGPAPIAVGNGVFSGCAGNFVVYYPAALSNQGWSTPKWQGWPAQPYDYRAVIATGSCGDAATWTIYGDDSLVISGSGLLEAYGSQYMTPWYQTKDEHGQPWIARIASITVESGILDIPDNYFGGAKALTEVEIPFSAYRIGRNAFEGCSSLTEVAFPRGMTLCVEAFKGCAQLRQVRFGPTPAQSSCIIGSGAFTDCPRLETVIIGSGAATLGSSADTPYICKNCPALRSVVFLGEAHQVSPYTIPYRFTDAVQEDVTVYHLRGQTDWESSTKWVGHPVKVWGETQVERSGPDVVVRFTGQVPGDEVLVAAYNAQGKMTALVSRSKVGEGMEEVVSLPGDTVRVKLFRLDHALLRPLHDTESIDVIQ